MPKPIFIRPGDAEDRLGRGDDAYVDVKDLARQRRKALEEEDIQTGTLPPKSTEVIATSSVSEPVTSSVSEPVERGRGWNLSKDVQRRGGLRSAESRQLMSKKEKSDHARKMVQARWAKAGKMKVKEV